MKINNSFSLAAEKYFSTLVLSLFYFILAYKIPEHELGVFTTIESIAVIFSLLSLFSIDSVFQNEALKNESKKEVFIFGALYIKLMLSIVAYIIFVLFCINFFSLDILPVSIIGLLIIARAGYIISNYFIVVENFKKYVCLGFSVTFLSLLIKIITLYFLSESYYSVLFSIDFIVFSTIYYYGCRKENINVTINDIKLYVIPVLLKGSPFILSSFTIIAYGKLDQIMISKMLGFNDAATYALQMKIIGSFVLVSNAFNLSYVPKLTKSKVESKRSYFLQVKKLISHTLLIGSILTLLCMFLAPIMLELIYPNKFEDARELISVSSVLILLIYLSSSIGRILIVESFGKIALLRNVVALVINIILNYFLIPTYGSLGAVYASIISWLISSVIMILYINKTRFIFTSLFNDRNYGEYKEKNL